MTLSRYVFSGSFLCLAIYLFATAPVPLSQAEQLPETDRGKCRHPVGDLFAGVHAINQAARTLYTKRIVGSGPSVGLKFGEDWREDGIEKGPLPALFLRETAAQLERLPPRLGLYLGSDAPINKSNLFSARQNVDFGTMKRTRAPVFLEMEAIGQVAMYPDVASAMPCVTCHNEHPDSPKTDWVLDDVMGATTWTYPEAYVSSGRYLEVTEAMLLAVQRAYAAYLDKVAGFSKPVRLGKGWPDAGARLLPDNATFMSEVRKLAAPQLIGAVFAYAEEQDDSGVNLRSDEVATCGS